VTVRRVPRRLRQLAGFVAALVLLWPAAEAIEPGAVGESIYRRGIVASGAPLEAAREGGVRVIGSTAACTNCHRRSGLGMKEGRQSIPPIAASYLFQPRAGAVDNLDLPYVDGMRADRDPYTEATLARAIRSGIGADGHPLSYLMPRYSLDDSAMTQLITYLKELSPDVVPGVTETVLHFATVITPDADPVKRQGMLDVLNTFFADKNRFTRAEAPRLRSSRRMMFKVNRHWELHVWELAGPPETWEAQLRAKLSAQPVFAVLSGLGGQTWEPVHRFCEEQSLPCLFPNVERPVVAEADFDSLYLTQGVLLEARLIAHELATPSAGARPRRIVQMFRPGDVGREAAATLEAALAGSGASFVNRALSGARARDFSAALRGISADDMLVLWLRPADIARLPAPPRDVVRVFLSGQMAGLEEAPLPAAWRNIAHMTYPYDLPERRRVRLDFPLGWFRIREIPVVAQQVQVDTYMVCGLVSDTLNHMVDTFVRDYLVERIEGMLEHRIITGYYPRLALAPGQRFASKGGFIVRFVEPGGTRVVPDGEWIIP
jgi:hypothetical protein